MAALVANSNHSLSDNKTNNNYLAKDQNLTYLDYEDFSHISLGYETYTDGIQHPLELRKILTGELAKEMSVTFKLAEDDTYKDLVHPCRDISADIIDDPEDDICQLEITESKSLSGLPGGAHTPSSYSNFKQLPNLLPRPPKLIKAGLLNPSSLATNQSLPPSLLTSAPPPVFLGGLWDPDPGSSMDTSALHHQQPDMDDLSAIISNRRPGRPAANQGTFDPESGTIRYLCRLECGASLASAKGRRKHEKKHCPNMPKEHTMMAGANTAGVHSLFANNPLMGHSLFHSRIPMKERDKFECRICGKVLKTYEGRRLHEKLQHKPKSSTQTSANSLDKDKSKDGDSLQPVELEDGEVLAPVLEDGEVVVPIMEDEDPMEDEEDSLEGVEEGIEGVEDVVEDIGDDDDE